MEKNVILKQEMIRLGFSLISLILVVGVMWLVYPKLLAQGSRKSADAYWRAEREANERRLFGGENEVPE